MNVELRAIDPDELDGFGALFEAYSAEIAAYDPVDPRPTDRATYLAALAEDPDGQDLEWIVADGAQAGFVVSRVVRDWPDDRVLVAEVVDCYVVPSERRRGIAEAAVALWLERQRAAGVDLVEAAVLAGNEAAFAFWRAQGFEVRSHQTARRP